MQPKYQIGQEVWMIEERKAVPEMITGIFKDEGHTGEINYTFNKVTQGEGRYIENYWFGNQNFSPPNKNSLTHFNMNRVIKFRAWDAIARTMFESLDLRDTRICGFYDLGYEIMQFTGLLDKNRKEIYEGDIVRCSKGCPHQVIWEEVSDFSFHCGRWYLDRLLDGYSWVGSEELIGNIYENPELLTPHP